MDGEKKNCPYCGEEILAVAIKCKHCLTNLDSNVISVEEFFSTENFFSIHYGLNVSGRITCFAERLNFFPTGFRMISGHEINIRYGDISDIRKLVFGIGFRVKTKYGEKFVFTTNILHRGEVGVLLGKIRSLIK